MCAAHPESRVWFLTYEDQDHDSVTNSAQVDYMGRVDDLFNGKEMGRGCSRIDVQPLTGHFQPFLVPYRAARAL